MGESRKTWGEELENVEVELEEDRGIERGIIGSKLCND